MAFILQYRCRIEGTAERVYQTITDLSTYKLWNPWLIDGQGSCEVGDVVEITVLLGGKPSRIRHQVIAAEPNKLFHWRDLGWMTFLADGDRKRELLVDGDACIYQVDLHIHGPLSFLVKWLMAKDLQHGLEQEALALKAYVENDCG